MNPIKTESKFTFENKETAAKVDLCLNYLTRTYEIRPYGNATNGFVFKGNHPKPNMHEPGKITRAEAPQLANQANIVKLIAEAMDFVDTEFQRLEGGSLHKPVIDKVYIVQADSGVIHGCFADKVRADKYTGDSDHMNVREHPIHIDN